MSNTYTPPLITISDGPPFRLMATSHNQPPVVCGERIFRAEPWPSVKFRHDTKEAAETDAATLRVYLAECQSGKRKDSNKPVQKPHWED